MKYNTRKVVPLLPVISVALLFHSSLAYVLHVLLLSAHPTVAQAFVLLFAHSAHSPIHIIWHSMFAT